MSVYKPATSRFFQYDFVYKARRFHGSTGAETRRAAERIERKLRQDAAEGRLGEASQLTLELGASKYWNEHGQHRGDAPDTERRLEVLLTLIPRTMPLVEITTAVVSEAIQRRRGMTFAKSNKPKAKRYTPTNGTVNRDVIQTLRPILRRAKIHWGAKGLPEIAWNELRLPEPRETVRVYGREDQDAWLGENGDTAALALRLLLTNGLRFGELFFPLDAFEDGKEPRLAWMKGRKKDVPHTAPLLEREAREIRARVSRARAAGLDTIWFAEVVDDGEVRLEAIGYHALHGRLRRSAKRAGIKPGRIIHGARHHAGTTIQRATGNMKTTQRALGHIDPKSTHRYVHAMDQDVRAALELVEQSRNSPEHANTDTKKSEAG